MCCSQSSLASRLVMSDVSNTEHAREKLERESADLGDYNHRSRLSLSDTGFQMRARRKARGSSDALKGLT